MASSFDQQAMEAIPAEVFMISGSHDTQTSADVHNVNSFQLPDPAGRAGGACTSALLQVMHNQHDNPGGVELTWVSLLRQMRTVLNGMGYDQVPQLTSSRMIDVNRPMHIVPPESSGTRRAILVGINYVGQQGELSGCHNDAKNIGKYLQDYHGFEESNMLILMDDGQHHNPTRANLISSFERIGQYSQPGDVVFMHYSGELTGAILAIHQSLFSHTHDYCIFIGHGGRIPDDNGDEDDGFDETLIPVDFQKAGQIRDDDVLKVLVRPLAQGVTMTCLMDCCHSGTVMDLPYRFTADGDVMERNEGVSFGRLMGSPEAVMGLMCCMMCLGQALMG